MNYQQAGSFSAANVPIDEAELVRIARRISQWRRKRDAILAPIVFADPEWDILLDLYVEGGCGRAVSLSSLCIAAAVPSTTAARAVNALVAEGVLTKSRDPEDARRVIIALADSTREKMRAWLTQIASSHVGR
jgi:DNA-binding MarR family transcriptional regulator